MSAAALAAAAAPALLVSNADAQNASVPADYSSVTFTSDAGLDAGRWSLRNPTGAAVAVYVGTARELSPSQIESVLRREFGANGVSNVQFFYEQNDTPATGFSLHENGNSFGIYRIGNVRSAVPTVAGQINLIREHPELAPRR